MFTPSGRNFAKKMVTIQVQKGKIELVDPDEMKTKELKYPIPWDEISSGSSIMVLSTLLIVCLFILW
jgi:hypothetical protein